MTQLFIGNPNCVPKENAGLFRRLYDLFYEVQCLVVIVFAAFSFVIIMIVFTLMLVFITMFMLVFTTTIVVMTMIGAVIIII